MNTDPPKGPITPEENAAMIFRAKEILDERLRVHLELLRELAASKGRQPPHQESTEE